MSNFKPELLSPAGSFDCGITAFTYGADAIYLGLKNFSARADALNFTYKELSDIVSLAHSLNKKVYVALNTLIQNSELPDLIQKLSTVDELSIDGIILQDFAVAHLIQKYFPKLQLHASTQMAVHNLEGAKILADMGFSRVVLARELSFSEIENISKKCGIETEVFIHGALCYSYSGLCFYSSFARGESANRGKCTYPCRKLYGGFHPYSMKDLSLNEYVLKLASIGVSSLKIEGRKKTPLYVSATTDYYRRILDGKDTKGCLDNIKMIFARPYTTLHFKGKNKDVIDKEFSGPRGLLIGNIENTKTNKITFKTNYPIEKHDGIAVEVKGLERPFGFPVDKMWVNGKLSFTSSKGDKLEIIVPDNSPAFTRGANIYCTSSQRVKSSYPFNANILSKSAHKTPLDIAFTMTSNEIKVISGTTSVIINDTFSPANNPDKMKTGTIQAFSKLGDTPFVLGTFKYENSGFFAPISVLNELRRQFIEKLTTKPAYIVPHITPPNYTTQTVSTGYIIHVDNVSYLSKFSKEDIAQVSEFMIDIFADISSINPLIPRDKIRLFLPMISRNTELPTLTQKIKQYISQGFNKFTISNIGGIYLVKQFNITDWTADYYLYTLNDYAVDYLLCSGAKRITLSPEDSSANMQSIIDHFAPNTDLLVYGDVPLFISDNCTGDCKNCHSTNTTIIRHCRHYVFGDHPYSLSGKTQNLHPANYRLDFRYKQYTDLQVYTIFQQVLNGEYIKKSTQANFSNGFK